MIGHPCTRPCELNRIDHFIYLAKPQPSSAARAYDLFVCAPRRGIFSHGASARLRVYPLGLLASTPDGVNRHRVSPRWFAASTSLRRGGSLGHSFSRCADGKPRVGERWPSTPLLASIRGLRVDGLRLRSTVVSRPAEVKSPLVTMIRCFLVALGVNALPASACYVRVTCDAS